MIFNVFQHFSVVSGGWGGMVEAVGRHWLNKDEGDGDDNSGRQWQPWVGRVGMPDWGS